MTIQLTEQQQQALASEPGEPPRVVNPRTNETFVLVRAEVYERLKALLAEAEDEQLVHDVYPHVMEVFGREGWDDPEMDVYDDLDPRRNP